MTRGLAAGAAAGSVTTALMYLIAPLIGIRALPQLLQDPILAAMPGPVFGFLIDRLQHLGKVIEEIGLIIAMIVALAILGALVGILRERFPTPHSGLAAALVAWLVVTLVVLPLGGAGLLGLSGGIVTPIAWAVLLVVYGVVLRQCHPEDPPADSSPISEGPEGIGRRGFLRLLPLWIGGAGLVVLALRLGPDWFRAVAHPPEAGAPSLTPEVTPTANFYLVSKGFQDPVIAASSWTLEVGGSVERTLRLGLDQLRALPAITETVTLECVSNAVGGQLMSTGRFTGVSLRELVDRAGAHPEATTVAFQAQDGYSESLPLKLVRETPEILVAYALDDQPLSAGHGFPARMLIPGHYGMKGPKWLQTIELQNGPGKGYWEGQGWDSNAIVKTTSRFDTPRDGAIVKLGSIPLAGVAFAGSRGIIAVEISLDGGGSWPLNASLRPPLSPNTWVLWTATWEPSAPGSFQLKVRARDGAGTTQTSTVSDSYPNGASGHHTIQVSVVH